MTFKYNRLKKALKKTIEDIDISYSCDQYWAGQQSGKKEVYERVLEWIEMLQYEDNKRR